MGRRWTGWNLAVNLTCVRFTSLSISCNKWEVRNSGKIKKNRAVTEFFRAAAATHELKLPDVKNSVRCDRMQERNFVIGFFHFRPSMTWSLLLCRYDGRKWKRGVEIEFILTKGIQIHELRWIPHSFQRPTAWCLGSLIILSESVPFLYDWYGKICTSMLRSLALRIPNKVQKILELDKTFCSTLTACQVASHNTRQQSSSRPVECKWSERARLHPLYHPADFSGLPGLPGTHSPSVFSLPFLGDGFWWLRWCSGFSLD
jgi:hypothetical protein